MKRWLKSTAACRWLKRLNERRIFRRAVRGLQHWSPEDEAMVRFYQPFIKPGELCYDVGANIGVRSKVFLRLGARVVAFEPQPECVEVLAQSFAASANFTLVRSAVGASEGEARLFRGDANTISTLSQEWIDAVRESGRFSTAQWRPADMVPVMTLERAMVQYGAPAFIKIDVEGFEEEVIKGLARPVAGLSIEVTLECLDRTLACMDRLERLGECRYNFSVDTMRMFHADWLTSGAMRRALAEMKARTPLMLGDLYVRYYPTSGGVAP